MSKSLLLSILLASIIVVGTSTPVWAAQLDGKLNPNNESSAFNITYQNNISINYSDGGDISNELQGKAWTVSGVADSSDPGVQDLIQRLNEKIRADKSQARISDMTVTYDFDLLARDTSTSIDYNVKLSGIITDYIITKDSQRALIDLGWRGLSVDGEVNVDDVEINIPINILKDQEPAVYEYLVGTTAEDVLNRPLINANFILEQPLTNWHFLFDPTGITVDAETFGLDQEILGYVVSSWTMGESSLREGRQVEIVHKAEFVSDKPYFVKSIQSADAATLSTIGFGALDILDGVEIVGVTPKAPEGYGTTATGEFPIFIVYGMAGVAAIAGIAFFFISSKSLKNEKQGQQGIDPSRLVGYQTSASSGGYHTNRGEAQLRDESDYNQTRTVYDEQTQQSSPPQTTPSAVDAACGCAASSEMGSECDCDMQGSCLCDATCGCNAEICKEQVRSMS